MKVDSPFPLLTRWLERWVTEKASFLPECHERTLKFTFVYRFEGDGQTKPESQVVVRYPATFEITAHPPKLPNIVN